jgi:hypothetical protein
VGSYKNLILKNYEARKDEFYMKDFWHRTKVSLLKSWPPMVGWGKCKWNADYISILAKVTQVSDVAHGPLVYLKQHLK